MPFSPTRPRSGDQGDLRAQAPPRPLEGASLSRGRRTGRLGAARISRATGRRARRVPARHDRYGVVGAAHTRCKRSYSPLGQLLPRARLLPGHGYSPGAAAPRAQVLPRTQLLPGHGYPPGAATSPGRRGYLPGRRTLRAGRHSGTSAGRHRRNPGSLDMEPLPHVHTTPHQAHRRGLTAGAGRCRAPTRDSRS
jgi:hypothetical protein